MSAWSLWFIEKTTRKSHEEYWSQYGATLPGLPGPRVGLVAGSLLHLSCPLLMVVQSSYANLIHHNIGKSLDGSDQRGHWSSHCCNSTQAGPVQLSLCHCLPTMDQFQPRQTHSGLRPADLSSWNQVRLPLSIHWVTISLFCHLFPLETISYHHKNRLEQLLFSASVHFL